MLNKTETKMEWEIEKNERKEEEKKKNLHRAREPDKSELAGRRTLSND